MASNADPESIFVNPTSSSLATASITGFVSINTEAVESVETLVAQTPIASFVGAAEAKQAAIQEPKQTESAQISLARAKVDVVRPERAEVKLNHATNDRKTESSARNTATRTAPVALGAGGTVNVNIGTLTPGDSVTITFQVVIDDPYTWSA